MEIINSIAHKTNVRVRYAETDGMGIVYNSNYLIYFEVGRVELMRHYNLVYAELEKAGYHMPLIESHIEYKQPAKYDDLLTIKTIGFFISPLKFKFEYEIILDDIVLTKGYTIHIFLDQSTSKPVKPPRIFLNGWEKVII